MARYEISAPAGSRLPLTPLKEFNPDALAFIDEVFAEYEEQVKTVGERNAVWPRHEAVTQTGLFIARILDRDTVMYHTANGSGGTSHSEQLIQANQIALGQELVSGGLGPGYDPEDDDHNGFPVFDFEARMPSGAEAPVSVRIGIRREGIPGLMVVSDLSTIPRGYHFFDPTFYPATQDPLRA